MTNFIHTATDSSLLAFYTAGKDAPIGSSRRKLSDDAANELYRRQSRFLSEIDTQEMSQVERPQSGPEGNE